MKKESPFWVLMAAERKLELELLTARCEVTYRLSICTPPGSYA